MSSDKTNSIWLSLQFITKLVFALIALKINLINFGDELFGIWLLLASIWGFSSALDFGFATSVIKFVAEYKNDENKVNKIISSSAFIFLALGLLIFLAGFLIGYFVYFLNEEIIAPSQKLYFLKVFLFLGIAFQFQYVSLFFRAIIEGLSNFKVTSKIVILQSLANFIGVIIIYYFSLSLLHLSILYIISFGSGLTIYLYYFSFRIKKYSIRRSYFEFAEVKKVVSFSFSVQAMAIFNALIDPLIKYVIGVHYNLGLVPAYEIARRFAMAISGLFFNAFKIILPKASALKNSEEKINFIKNEMVDYCKYGIAYSGVSFGVLSLPISLLIRIVFGNEEAILVFLILALPESINNFGSPLYNFLLGTGRTKFLALIQLNNLIFVAIAVTIGFIIFKNPLGLIGYFFSVIIANIAMIVYMGKNYISLKKFLRGINIVKLILLISSMITVIVLYDSKLVNYWLLFSSLSFVSLLIFYSDIKIIYVKVLRSYLKKNDDKS